MIKSESIGHYLKEIVERYGLQKRIDNARIFSEWEKWVDKPICDVAKPVKLEFGKLLIKVSNDAWRNELVYQKRELIERLNEKLGEQIIKEITFI